MYRALQVAQLSTMRTRSDLGIDAKAQWGEGEGDGNHSNGGKAERSAPAK